MLNQIIHGDCLEVMKDIKTSSVDMILCDLPYGTTQSEWDVIISFEPLWNQYERVIKPNGAIVLFAKPPFDKMLWASNPKLYRYDWVWKKNKATGHLNANRMPLQDHEYLLVFYKQTPTYNPQMTDGHEPMNYAISRHTSSVYGNGKDTINRVGVTDRYPRSTLFFPVVNNDDPIRIHPNQKPVELCQYMIKTYTNEGETVLDNCSGSGVVAESCVSINRNFIGIERDKEFHQKSVQRLKIVQPVMNF